MTVELKAPMTKELAWANVMRPRIPLVYLDLNTIIYIARATSGGTKVPGSYGDLYTAALRAKFEQRAMFPLSGEHLWEISKITDPKQRGDIADILETLSDYNYLWAAQSSRSSSSRPAWRRSWAKISPQRACRSSGRRLAKRSGGSAG